MTELSLSAVNAKSPYCLRISPLGGFDFDTDTELTYNIALIQDHTLGDDFEAYMLNILPRSMEEFRKIRQEHRVKVRADNKIKNTLVALLEEAMKNRNIVIDYVCMSEDYKQSCRARLFEMWFKELADNEKYRLFTTSLKVENVTNHFGAFICRDNDKYNLFCEAFKNFDRNIHKDSEWNVEN